jgi:hypothetical protein
LHCDIETLLMRQVGSKEYALVSLSAITVQELQSGKGFWTLTHEDQRVVPYHGDSPECSGRFFHRRGHHRCRPNRRCC